MYADIHLLECNLILSPLATDVLNSNFLVTILDAFAVQSVRDAKHQSCTAPVPPQTFSFLMPIATFSDRAVSPYCLVVKLNSAKPTAPALSHRLQRHCKAISLLIQEGSVGNTCADQVDKCSV